MRLKETLKQNKITYYWIKKIRKAQNFLARYLQVFLYPNIQFRIKQWKRILRIGNNSVYEKLKEMKNKHAGERCFIVATGPSLTIEDIEKLKNEITFSMNTICLAFDETDWRPTYYGIQDDNVYIRMKKYFQELKSVKGMFVSDAIPKMLKEELSAEFYYMPVKLLYHNEEKGKYKIKFSDNPFSVVYNGYTITYSLLQMAVYMGFKDIYLLGADCHYAQDMNHHFRNYDHVDPTFASAGEMMTVGYKKAKKYADKSGISIYNATRGGKLEVFERVDLDDVVGTRSITVK